MMLEGWNKSVLIIYTGFHSSKQIDNYESLYRRRVGQKKAGFKISCFCKIKLAAFKNFQKRVMFSYF